MQVALIPPHAFLEDTTRTNIQLMLPQQMEATVYNYTYRKHCKDPEQYVIMDNGAAEHNQIDDDMLMQYATEYLPNELAMPDVLYNRIETVERSARFWEKHHALAEALSIKLGYVAQGTTPGDAYDGVMNMMLMGVEPSVIYLPRLLITSPKRIETRLTLAESLYGTFGDLFELHLFGSSPFWPKEVDLLKQLPFLRSIDTSMPYSYAYQGAGWNDDPVARPKNYFDLEEKDFIEHPAARVEEYLSWVK